jgi:flagellar assembly factor FliW
MKVMTIRFGEIDIDDASVIDAPEGLLGFERCKRFVLLTEKPESCFKWLQSADDPAVAFMVAKPMDFFPDYEVILSDEQVEWLGLTHAADAEVLSIVTASLDTDAITINLVGPVVVNAKTLRARQIVLGDERYGLKHIIGYRKQTEQQRAMMV